MSQNQERNDYPTYKEIITTPRPDNVLQPFKDDGQRSKAEVAVANAGVLLAFVVLIIATIAVYAGALWLTNFGRDLTIDMMPGSANFANLIGIALKVLATIAVAWFMKICWDCFPYVVSKLREHADQVF